MKRKRLLAGDVGRRRPAEVLIDPLFAKALILDDGERRLCILSLDVDVVTKEWGDKIRTGAKERFGLEPDAVMVHVMQSHSSPSMGHRFFILGSAFL